MQAIPRVVRYTPLNTPSDPSLALFLAQVGKWADALQRNDISAAAFYLGEISAVGRLLSADPAFRRLVQSRSDGGGAHDPDRLLAAVHQFFDAVQTAKTTLVAKGQ